MPKAQKPVEDVYLKTTHLEHVLLRPDTYIGSVEPQSCTTWVHDGEAMVLREVTVSPGLYRIFDEILVNAADNQVRDSSQNEVRVEVLPEENLITVWNNGQGIPIEVHKKEKVYVPELIFGNLLTSSNFDDAEKKLTGGRNGFGAKLANIFSTEFVIETGDGAKEYRQLFANNMKEKEDPRIQSSRLKSSWTRVSFKPDLVRFGMTHLDDDIVAVLRKRTYDLAGLLGKTVKVYFNKEKLPVRTFEDYVDLYLGKKSEGTPRVHLKANDRWELVVACTDGEFRQMSFVNAICTSQGGTHVNYVVDQICKALVEKLNKKMKTSLRSAHVKNHLHVFLNCMIENPAFDSQTKENLMTRVSEFGSKCVLPDEFVDKVAKCGVLDQLVNLAQLKSTQLLKKSDGSKTSKISIPKLDDANFAGTKKSIDCTLILTEGDSAKALATAGMSVVGRDTYGVFPLRGKLLNVRDAPNDAISKNKEIQSLKRIIGLQHNTAYSDTKRLRYGHIMIMTDQDFDGSHIKGLIINFLHQCHPSLLQLPKFIQVFTTPIIKASRGKQERAFFTVPEYEAWKGSSEGLLRSWRIKYYKGLGTSDRQDGISYFRNLPIHKKQFVYEGAEADDSIDMAFSKKRVGDRKEWLRTYQEGTYFDHSQTELTFTEFVNKELILYSLADLDRSIPNLMDGLKVAQRKILYSVLKRGSGEVKVMQLLGYISQHSVYHHGEASLSSTVIGMAQNYVGSNNINLLKPAGQFGTRIQGGKDCASSRYLHTDIASLTRFIFDKSDDDLLHYLEDDGQSIQPKWYVPVIPMILVNGADGIGTGWSTNIPNYNPLEVIDNLLRMLDGEEPTDMLPWYMGYTGTIARINGGDSYVVTGRFEVDEEAGAIEIQELGLKKWTDDYKEFLREAAAPPDPQIADFADRATDTAVRFTVYVSPEQLEKLRTKGIAESLKLTSRLSTGNMVLFSPEGSIRKYSSVTEILSSFFDVRREYYVRRKASILSTAEREMKRLDNKARFVMAVVEDRLVLAKRKLHDIVADMEGMGFDKLAPKRKKAHQTEGAEEAEDGASDGANYDYLLKMEMMSMSLDLVQKITEELEQQRQKVARISQMKPEDMWREDLQNLRSAYEDFLADYMENMTDNDHMDRRPGGGRRGGRGRGRGRGGGRTAVSAQGGSGRGRGGRNAGGRGRGRGGRTAPESDATAGSSNPGLVLDFQQFELGSSSANPSQPPPAQLPAPPLSGICEEEEVTSPVRKPKRKERGVVLLESEDEQESVGEVPVAERPKRPRRAARGGSSQQVVEISADEEEEALDSDSDFEASKVSNDSDSS